jgi:hypothetical protein
MPRVTISLRRHEMDVLRKLAEAECRDVRSQATLIVRHELERTGLFPYDSSLPTSEASATPEINDAEN